jgi:hypothetical protein
MQTVSAQTATAMAALNEFGASRLIETPDFALLPKVGFGLKPVVFPTIYDLARRIHRDRGHEALDLQPATFRFAGAFWKGVEVLAIDQRSERTRRIGHAWISGRPIEVLKAALDVELVAHASPLRLARAL